MIIEKESKCQVGIKLIELFSLILFLLLCNKEERHFDILDENIFYN